ncbi:ferredoxin reductase family protein [Desulfoluna spongiiphila]|uniref:Predicted ferric reductase n=1 Tax=Desulfoluna spongiiphila TaxID=419481 RepID=A0A1G5GA67_9BACT|nr:ferredoxin reductase family protein [Desulfoluna spongiiphila]SCY48516.1 Predicted ferric reductase [Desulfoluna spongiiphila]
MSIRTAPVRPRGVRYGLFIGCLAVLLLLFCGAFSIPFLFESFSIKYKFGIAKGLLRSGKLMGMAAALLLGVQLVLASRLTWVNRMAGMDSLLAVHKANGILIALIALGHPLLVFAPEELTALPLKADYWPEIVGAFLLMGLFYMTAAALFKKPLGFPFHLWMRAHQAGGVLVLALLVVHLLFSSETFEEGLPRALGLAFGALCLGLLLRRHLPALRPLSPWRVSRVFPAGKRATRIHLKPEGKGTFSYLPGQFAFLSFPSSVVSSEEHPFTIASSPTRTDTLEFIIGKSGDWTRGMDCVREGDPAIIDGPYGSFSHLLLPDGSPVVLIAGGIGVTPMLSMLRYMDDTRDSRPVILIWSNRTHDSLFNAEELVRIKRNHPTLSVHLLFTGEPEKERLTAGALNTFIGHLSLPQVFLCGPPPMMTAVETMLKGIGIPKGRIHTETFGF